MNQAQLVLNNYYQDATTTLEHVIVSKALFALAAEGIGANPYTGKTPVTATIDYIEGVIGPGRLVDDLRRNHSELLAAEAKA
jgi:hypothetical protein